MSALEACLELNSYQAHQSLEVLQAKVSTGDSNARHEQPLTHHRRRAHAWRNTLLCKRSVTGRLPILAGGSLAAKQALVTGQMRSRTTQRQPTLIVVHSGRDDVAQVCLCLGVQKKHSRPGAEESSVPRPSLEPFEIITTKRQHLHQTSLQWTSAGR